jgi:ubiquinone/menaquinone biosynthesis C-methylase UbiE
MSFDPEAVREFERDSWNRAATMYEGSFATASRLFVESLLDAVEVAAGMRVLDVCCGTGVGAGAAEARGAHVTGLDFSAGMLDVGRRHYPDVTFEAGDAEALPYGDGEFDVVFSNFGIHHVPRPSMVLKEIHRVLRPGRLAAFTIWAPQSENIAMKLVHDAITRHGDPSLTKAPPAGHALASPEECAAALQDAGFEKPRAEILYSQWHHADARSLVTALQTGTARMGARLNAQPVGALPAIIADVNAATARYNNGTSIAVPMAAIVAVGRKPGIGISDRMGSSQA